MRKLDSWRDFGAIELTQISFVIANGQKASVQSVSRSHDLINGKIRVDNPYFRNKLCLQKFVMFLCIISLFIHFCSHIVDKPLLFNKYYSNKIDGTNLQLEKKVL